ncbi:unnamed protein product [Penicillium olsonii]|uniref:Uncharacterized protein n=1 Tax=Penicillium olsonii TaxID=99116 RepID=A0A9W4HHJ6_PENOL|nr:unnamed protein product [Penicillium olsonii]CAG8067165.1 unnamed protein product [Penicillium olsonii]CAG8077243.1 unnamed protein product [Penicillium olsonii]
MFKTQPLKVAQSQNGALQKSRAPVAEEIVFSFGSPPTVLNTGTGRLAAAFVETLEVTDIRYAVTYYGPFLREIPQRLGNSTVLDSAVKAVSSAYPYVHKGAFPTSVLVNYGQSLRALRDCLNNPSEARTAHTLCAVYLITICQSWLGKVDDSLTSHSEAIACLLKASSLGEWRSHFEMEMVITLCVPIILEGVINPRIRMDPHFWEMMTTFRKRLNPQAFEKSKDSTQLHHLAMLPEFVQHPDPYAFEIAKMYLSLKRDAGIVKMGLDQFATFVPNSFSGPYVDKHSKLQAAYTIVSTLAVLLNTLLRLFNPSNPTLEQETAFFCEEILTQAQLAQCYRPMGSAYMPLSLVVAWASTNDIVQLARIEALLADYQNDFAELPWMNRGIWLASLLNSHRERIALEMTGSVSPISNPGEVSDRGESCCIL